MKWTIACDARPLSTPMSGVGRLIHEILWNFPEKENYQFLLFSHLEIHPDHERILSLQNTTWKKIPKVLINKGGFAWNFVLPFQLLFTKYDLFWGSQQVIPPLFSTKPVVLTFCDFVSLVFPETMRTVARWQQRIFQSYSIAKSDHCLSISENTRNELISFYGYNREHTSVSYPGVFTKLQKLPNIKEIRGIQIPKQFFLSVSTVEPRKNYPFLFSVYSEYYQKQKQKAIPWVIAGKMGWEKKEFLDKLLDFANSTKKIILLNSVTEEELHFLYAKASLFLFASTYEGFGIPLAEALVYNLPCVVSDIPTFREIGQNQVQYLETNSTTPWLKILERKSWKKTKADLQLFSWKKASEKTREAFASVLSQKQPN